MGKWLLVAAMLIGVIPSAIAGAQFIQMSPDTYMVTYTDKGGVFSSEGNTKAKMVKAAQEFAAEQGKVAVIQSMSYRPGGPGRFAAGELQVVLVDKAAPKARQRVILEQAPDTTVDIRVDGSASGSAGVPQQSSAEPDVYSELIKLDDLKKRGIITDAEFQAQKQKILESN